jgi:ubiquinone/menaquinone biosynthesis C-methylase UbiE
LSSPHIAPPSDYLLPGGTVLDYNHEASHYDATRGGEERARAAATAVEQLLSAHSLTAMSGAPAQARPDPGIPANTSTLASSPTPANTSSPANTSTPANSPTPANTSTPDNPTNTQTLIDVACGTGIVTQFLVRPTRNVIGVDQSHGMLHLASRRLPTRVILGDAARLPIETASVDAVVLIWLLHLLPDAALVLAEAARVLRPGGVLITTVDKDQAAFAVSSDVATVTASIREPHALAATDQYHRIVTQASLHGLKPVNETTFSGTGQGRSPEQWQELIRTGKTPWLRHPDTKPEATSIAYLIQALAALPDQQAARPDPLYRLIALTRFS